jgi:hypothetical protein
MPAGDVTGLLLRYFYTDTELSSPGAYTARVRQAAFNTRAYKGFFQFLPT